MRPCVKYTTLINITHCGYCHRKLEWKQIKKGGTEETNKREIELFNATNGRLPLLMHGPPRIQWIYGCPMYGVSKSPLGWHYYWWEDELQSIFEQIKKELTNAET